MRRSAVAISICLLAALAWSGVGHAAPNGEAGGKAKFYAAWRTFGTQPVASKDATLFEAEQRIHRDAVAEAEAAVTADPKNTSYLATLAYFQLVDADYGKAKKTIDAAIQRERRQPLLYLLRGQAEAALAMMDPTKSSKEIGPAITAFDQAAAMDPTNSLAPLQAASVALDVGRTDLALPRLKQALARPALRLYEMPVPADLDAKRSAGLRKWEQLQFTFWRDWLMRCQNVTRALTRLGDDEVRKANPDGAEAYYQQAMEIGKQVGKAEPHTFLSFAWGMDILDEAYQRLGGLAKARAKLATMQSEQAKAEKQDTKALDADAARWNGDAQRWNGERGVLQVARGDLVGSLQQYQAILTQKPPSSVDEMLQTEAKLLAWCMNGIGLTTGPAESPWGKPKELTAPQAPAKQ